MAATPGNPPPDHFFRAFADTTRLRILSLLTSGELCVCDIVNVLKLSQPKISRHLACLRRAGLVKARKQGLWSYYQLAPSTTDLHTRLLSCLACCVNDIKELSGDIARLRSRKFRPSPGSCC